MGLGIVAAGVGFVACSAEANPGANSSAANADSTSPTPSTAVTKAPATATDTDYADGEYTATGWYGGLPSHHDVTLTIDDDVVTAVEITTPAEDETSLGYQRRFAEALPGAVIGRNIDEIALDRLAGSSGCSEGFMAALAKIKDQAAA
ncbi:FMN-binding protein [Microbacterium terricola]|uniref:FMN-binding protein n=1 Tax=Microbacterium terricola TaxID=344163 RepID=UPI0021E9644A|nr:hypothetical protein [Microbacterium terricola]UYK40048.1 hypothetical protein OAU46_15385 [Microbacterium terricola]